MTESLDSNLASPVDSAVDSLQVPVPVSPFVAAPTASAWNQRLMTSVDAPLVGLDTETQAALTSFDRDRENAGRPVVDANDACRCSGLAFETIATTDRYGLGFGARLCMACGLLQQHPAVAPALRGPALSQLAEHGTAVSAPPTYRHLSRAVAIKPPETAIYLGSHPAGREALSARLSSNTEVRWQRDVRALSGPVDLLVVDGVIERTTDHDDANRTLQHLGSAVGPNGVIYYRSEGLMNLHRRHDLWFDYLRYRHPARLYDLDLAALCRLLSTAGWALVIGDEEIEAIFRRGNAPLPDHHAEQVLAYLKFVEMARPGWTSARLEEQRQAARIRHLEHQLDASKKEFERAEAQIARMKTSASWRMTSPLRALTASTKRVLDSDS